MEYKGIEAENKFINGSWFTLFSLRGDIIKTVEWRGTFGEDDVKQVIDRQILFIRGPV